MVDRRPAPDVDLNCPPREVRTETSQTFCLVPVVGDVPGESRKGNELGGKKGSCGLGQNKKGNEPFHSGSHRGPVFRAGANGGWSLSAGGWPEPVCGAAGVGAGLFAVGVA